MLGLARAAEPGDLIVAKGNCGIPHYQDGQIHYDGTPEVMADYACLARDAGARIIGGCCGTTPAHIAAMAEALATRPAGPPPDRATIEAALGPLARRSPASAAAASAGAARRLTAGRGLAERPAKAARSWRLPAARARARTTSG